MTTAILSMNLIVINQNFSSQTQKKVFNQVWAKSFLFMVTEDNQIPAMKIRTAILFNLVSENWSKLS